MKLLSREAKTLVGVFILTLAFWLWMNYFVQVRQATWSEQQLAQRQGVTSIGAMFVNAPVPVAPPNLNTTETVLFSAISDPPDATISINGVAVAQKTPFVNVEVSSGVGKVVRVSIGGYGFYEGIEDFVEDRNLSYAVPQFTPEQLAAIEAQGGVEQVPTSFVASLLTAEQLAFVAPYLLQPEASMIAREVTIRELPFLVGAAPTVSVVGEDGQPLEGSEEGDGTLASRRATINPFVPIVILSEAEIRAIAEAEEAARLARIVEAQRLEQERLTALSRVQQSTTVAGNGSTGVGVSSGPPAPEAPPPAVYRPQVAVSNPLPRALPRGTLVIAPNILRSALAPTTSAVTTQGMATSDIPADEQLLMEMQEPLVIETPQAEIDILDVTINGTPVDDFAFEDVAMVRVPGEIPNNGFSAPGLDSGPGDPSLPAPRPFMITPPEEIVVEAPEVVVEVVEPTSDDGSENVDQTSDQSSDQIVTTEAPIVVAINEAARFVRDNNVIFTGSVQGPTSNVGIFRTAFSNSPIVVSLGQNFPETNVFLTELTGQEAQLTQGSDSETLILDLRR